jgi:hypothetical protein
MWLKITETLSPDIDAFRKEVVRPQALLIVHDWLASVLAGDPRLPKNDRSHRLFLCENISNDFELPNPPAVSSYELAI